MALRGEYYGGVNRWNRATMAVLGLVFAGLLSVSAGAQINAAPPSVTSMGFGGRAINGLPPSVTSLGPRGYTPGFNPAFPNSRPSFGTNSGLSGHRPHHHPRFPQGDLACYATPYYGYYDNGTDAQNYAPEDEYNGGPTIFDRRGPGYVPPVREPERPEDASVAPPEAAPEPSTPTVLVFKDGHLLEVENYAIVGSTLYDLTEGHRRRVALADLDLTATAKQNDDRGIDFHLPAGAEAN
jgi:hypothetical protein